MKVINADHTIFLLKYRSTDGVWHNLHINMMNNNPFQTDKNIVAAISITRDIVST